MRDGDRMHRRNLLIGVVGGIISGIFLGLFLKGLEDWTSIRVYTLLLNIDYIPWLNSYKFPEIIEFGLHVIISIVLSVILIFYFGRKPLSQKSLILRVMWVGLTVGLLLYPTTSLSDRTPEMTDFAALFLWLIGHVLYGLLLGLLIAYKPRRWRL